MPTKPKTYEAERIFNVKLTRITDFRGAPLLPLPVHEMTGEALAEIVAKEGEDIVEYATPV